MELARIIVLEIATASLRVVSAATEYAGRRGFKNVKTCHFRLEKEMQRISVAASGILGVLDESSPPNGPPLDDRLQEWFSTDELPMCSDTLRQMEKMLRDDTWMHTILGFVNTLRSLPAEDKIDEAVKLFDSRKSHFHFLLTTDVWNCEDARQQSPRLAHVQDGSVIRRSFGPNTNAMEVDQDNIGIAKRVIISEEEAIKQNSALRKLDDILKWLNGLSCAAKQEETLSLRQPDTCTWLHSTPEYEAWRNSDDSSLWLQGKPGSGKTVLASFVIDSLKDKQHKGQALAFFYCDFRNDRSTSAAEVMRSLLSQLLRHVRKENVDPGGLVDDLIREKNGDTPVLENVQRLATLVSQTARQFNQQPLVVVDALDECKDIKKLLDGLLIFAKGGMRLFVTSRPLQTIKDSLCALPSIPIDEMASAVSADISLHVTRELDSSPRLRVLDLHFKMEIHSVLCCRADGMFRWVQCQIDTLNRCATKAEVREALDSLPIGLDETYERILIAIDLGSPEGKLALRALVWLIGALRPLRLVEILEGLTIDPGRRIMDPETGAMHKGILLYACGSLVTYNEKTDILILSHFSVREYLTGELARIKLSRYHISYQSAHENLARICLCYVALYLKHIHESSENTPQHRIMRTINGRSYNTTKSCFHLPESSPMLSTSQELLGYVFTEGFNHLAYLDSANHVVLKDMATLQSDIRYYPVAWQNIRQMSSRYNLQVMWPGSEHDFMFYILTAFGSDSLLLAFLGPTRRVLSPKYQTNPLVYAAHFGKPQHAQLLLSRGAKVNEKGLIVEAYRQALPLEVAVSRQHDVMVDLLLSAGSVVPQQLFARTRDQNFPVRISRMLLQTDEFMEWATNPENRLLSPVGLLERRLSLVYERDIIVMIRRLVQVGSDLNVCNSSQKTALHLAITGGYQAVMLYLLLIGAPLPGDFSSAMSRITLPERTSVVRLIVGARIDVCVHDTGDTALHLVMRYLEQDECLEATQVLVGAGFQPSTYNQAHETPLHLALEQGYCSVADYLLLQLGPAPTDALSAVLESRCPIAWTVGTMRILVNAGADIHAITSFGDGLLHQAVILPDEHRGLEVAKFVVGAGCDPLRRNIQGKTSLDLALDRKRSLLADYLLSIVKLPSPDTPFAIPHSALPAAWRARAICSLVSNGVNPSELSADGNSLLHATVLSLDESWAIEATEALVGAGYNPFKCNTRGRTLFNLALNRKYSLLADYLLSIVKLPPPDTLFAILHSALPAAWRARTTCSLVSNGVNPSELSADGNSLLHATVLSLDESRATEVAEVLVGAGCDPFKCNTQGETPFNLALNHNYPLLVDYLLSIVKLPPPDTLFAILHSALPAAWRARTTCSLVSNGVNPSELSADGNSLLHATVLSLDESRATEVAEVLVGAGCDPFKCNTQGETPFNLALNHNYPLLVDHLLWTVKLPPPDTLLATLRSPLPAIRKTQIVRSLVYKGADVHRLSADGDTLLHVAVLSLENQALEVAKILVGAGCDPSVPNRRGKTVLSIAVEEGSIPFMEYILSLDQLLPDDILFSVLKLHRSWKVPAMLRMLIKKSADVHIVTVGGNSLLHVAITSYGPTLFTRTIVEILVVSGCDAFRRNSRGETPLHLAVAKCETLVVTYLLSIPTRPACLPADILTYAFDQEYARGNLGFRLATLRFLIREGADVCVRGAGGGSLLHAAIKGIPQLSFPHAGDSGPNDSQWQSESSRKYLEPNPLEIIKLLVDSGCDPSQCDTDEHPPIYFAIIGGHVDIVEYLLPRTVFPLDNLQAAVGLAPRGVQGKLGEMLTVGKSLLGKRKHD